MIKIGLFSSFYRQKKEKIAIFNIIRAKIIPLINIVLIITQIKILIKVFLILTLI